MLIKFLRDAKGPTFGEAKKGDVKDVPDSRAQLLIDAKYAKAAATPEPAAAAATATETDLDGLNVADVVALVEKAESTERLSEIQKAEKAGKARVGVLEAIDKRKAELKG